MLKFFLYLVFFIVESREVVSVVGGKASLPCDLTPPFPSDEPHLILFYKDVYGTPIYRSVKFSILFLHYILLYLTQLKEIRYRIKSPLRNALSKDFNCKDTVLLLV